MDITIAPDGKISIQMKGIKGENCKNYSDFFAKLLGDLESQEWTQEYYEQNEDVEINISEDRNK